VSRPLRLFVTGTDTGVGKTVFSGLLARHFLEQGLSVRYIKPVQTGHPPDDDSAEVRRISGLSADRTELLLTAAEPVAPCFVFDPFPFEEIVATIRQAPETDVLLVESAGGLLVPLDERRRNVDLVGELDLEVVLVVSSRLGCLNQTLLNDAYLASKGLPLHGYALNEHFVENDRARQNHRTMLQTLLPGKFSYRFDRELTVLSPSGGLAG
jgi:dethiobiotin synthetase